MNMDSRSDDWCQKMECIEKLETSGNMTAEIECERAGVSED